MGMCQKIMSVLFKGKFFKIHCAHEDVEQDDDIENTYCSATYIPNYAIKEKRPLLNRKGSYSMYVVHSGDVNVDGEDSGDSVGDGV